MGEPPESSRIMNRRTFLAGISTTSLVGVAGCINEVNAEVKRESFRETSYVASVDVTVTFSDTNFDALSGTMKLIPNHPIRQLTAYNQSWTDERWIVREKKDVESSERTKKFGVSTGSLPAKIDLYDETGETVERIIVPEDIER